MQFDINLWLNIDCIVTFCFLISCLCTKNIYCRLVPDRPEWATEYEILLATSDSQKLSWKVPESNGDSIDYYALRYCSVIQY